MSPYAALDDILDTISGHQEDAVELDNRMSESEWSILFYNDQESLGDAISFPSTYDAASEASSEELSNPSDEDYQANPAQDSSHILTTSSPVGPYIEPRGSTVVEKREKGKADITLGRDTAHKSWSPISTAPTAAPATRLCSIAACTNNCAVRTIEDGQARATTHFGRCTQKITWQRSDEGLSVEQEKVALLEGESIRLMDTIAQLREEVQKFGVVLEGHELCGSSGNRVEPVPTALAATLAAFSVQTKHPKRATLEGEPSEQGNHDPMTMPVSIPTANWASKTNSPRFSDFAYDHQKEFMECVKQIGMELQSRKPQQILEQEEAAKSIIPPAPRLHPIAAPNSDTRQMLNTAAKATEKWTRDASSPVFGSLKRWSSSKRQLVDDWIKATECNEQQGEEAKKSVELPNLKVEAGTAFSAESCLF